MSSTYFRLTSKALWTIRCFFSSHLHQTMCYYDQARYARFGSFRFIRIHTSTRDLTSMLQLYLTYLQFYYINLNEICSIPAIHKRDATCCSNILHLIPHSSLNIWHFCPNLIVTISYYQFLPQYSFLILNASKTLVHISIHSTKVIPLSV